MNSNLRPVYYRKLLQMVHAVTSQLQALENMHGHGSGVVHSNVYIIIL